MEVGVHLYNEEDESMQSTSTSDVRPCEKVSGSSAVGN
ncbi:uncharacterized protein G2W53_012395 [Senna tora]|uniref:Uncharacterized protein n=1 Tax=Senna tora TaxID=362788 RepID=A0A834WPQ6_9FABA|nr:uncharacterized protein G2W53_012395 [Senna tora]